jgi:hypothetical protein
MISFYRSGQTDLCFFEELEIGEVFYLPFHGGVAEKVSESTFDTMGGEFPALNEPWVVARFHDMVCRRCGCDELHACHDERGNCACGWARPGLCTACLTDAEFAELQLQEEMA